MKRIITLALMALTLTGGVAMADRDRGRDRHDRREHRWERRDHRRDNRVDHRRWQRDNRWDRRDRHVHVQRTRPTFRNNRFYFNGGFHRVYRPPVIRHRYRDYYRRPAIIVENYDPVPGYIWVAGHWNWNGYEWVWINGHYEVDVNYQYQYGY